MTIMIKKEPAVELAQAEYEKLMREWRKAMQYTSAPVSFETWVKSRQGESK